MFKGHEHKVKYGVRSPKFIWDTVYSFTHWMRPRNPPPPSFGLIYEGAIGQPRQTTSLGHPQDMGVTWVGTWCLLRAVI
jgi:hypothetical protein